MQFNKKGMSLALMSLTLVAGLGLSACSGANSAADSGLQSKETTAQVEETKSQESTKSESKDASQSASTIEKAAPAISLQESELDQKVGSYTYNGKTEDVTAKMAIENATSLEAAKLEDGNYPYPTAELILAYVRTQVMNSLVAQNGITVDDAQIQEFIKHNFGEMSLADVAKQFNLTEEKAKQILTDSAGAFELSKKVSGGMPAEPQAPQAPEPGKETETTEAYAEYVKSLVGDAWDSEKNEWNPQGGNYYTALKDFSFDGKVADYNLAQAAYYVAYSDWTAQSKENSKTWLNFINQEYAKASVTIDKVTQ